MLDILNDFRRAARDADSDRATGITYNTVLWYLLSMNR